MGPRSFGVVTLGVLLAISAPARADELSQLSGRVLDSYAETAVEGALVYVAGPKGLEHTLTTDKEGRYTIAVHAGMYHLIFVYGESRTSGRVAVVGGKSARLDGHVESLSGEVIEVHGRVAPPVPPKPIHFSERKAPPYSERAILSDAWTRAWMLLDISATGTVLRMKFLKRPGFDLEDIAIREIFKLRFEPARDSANRPVETWLLWGIEWPSNGWLVTFVGTRSAMPPIVGFPPRSLAAGVPCAGSGPMHLDSIYPTYRDCSMPDLSQAAREPWITPPAAAR